MAGFSLTERETAAFSYAKVTRANAKKLNAHGLANPKGIASDVFIYREYASLPGRWQRRRTN
jgi:hypothetical protein